jgi:hypothetical protein
MRLTLISDILPYDIDVMPKAQKVRLLIVFENPKILARQLLY